jgi:hypothetical protein
MTSYHPHNVLDRYDASLRTLNARNPEHRRRLLDAQSALETRFTRAQHLVDHDAHTMGHRYSEQLIARRDLIDAQLTAIFQMLSEAREYSVSCRSAACHEPAGAEFDFSGYCPDCFAAARAGSPRDFPIDALPKPVVGIYGTQPEHLKGT